MLKLVTLIPVFLLVPDIVIGPCCETVYLDRGPQHLGIVWFDIIVKEAPTQDVLFVCLQMDVDDANGITPYDSCQERSPNYWLATDDRCEDQVILQEPSVVLWKERGWSYEGAPSDGIARPLNDGDLLTHWMCIWDRVPRQYVVTFLEDESYATLADGNSVPCYFDPNYLVINACQSDLEADINKDCRVDIRDMAILADQWMIDLMRYQ